MIQLSRNIGYDTRLKRHTLDIVADGQNETLIFDTYQVAYAEHSRLRRQGAEYLPPALDGSL